MTNPAPNHGVILGRCLQCELLAIGTGSTRGSRVGFGVSSKQTLLIVAVDAFVLNGARCDVPVPSPLLTSIGTVI